MKDRSHTGDDGPLRRRTERPPDPGAADPGIWERQRERARALAAFFAAGSVTGTLSIYAPGPGTVDELVLLATTAAAAVVAMVLLALGGRLPSVAVHTFLAFGTVMVSVGVEAWSGLGGSSMQALYVWITLYAFYFFDWRIAAAQLLFLLVCSGGVLVWDYGLGALSPWLLVAGSNLGAAFVVGSLARRVRWMTRLDPLTGLANRRGWDETLDRELARARREGSALSMALLDLDDFKEVNDTEGHHAGDELLRRTSAAWAGAVRASDLLARFGGDEFAVLLPDCGPECAGSVLERLRASSPPGVSFSAGVAALEVQESKEKLALRADHALYAAKSAGRACTRAARRASGTATPDAEEGASVGAAC